MGITYMHAVVPLDGFIADEQDGVGPLHDWYFNGDHPLVAEDRSSTFRVSAASVEYGRGIWERQSALVIGRRLFDLTDGWEGNPPACDHVVVESHRPKPDGWHPEASYHFVTSVEEAVALAHDLAEGGDVGVTAGDVGGQAIALGLIDSVALDVVPVVFGHGKRYFGDVTERILLRDPDVVIQGEGVLHLRYPVGRGVSASI